MTHLSDIKKKFEEFAVIKDEHVLDMLLATFVGNMIIPKDPIWTMIIAPSSGGKTLLISPFTNINHAFFVDDLTEKTLLSGFKVKGKETSLLKQIGSGMLCISDYTSILSKNDISRKDILTQLRMVYDGNFIKRTGTGVLEWHGKIGMIAGCTPDIYHYLENERSAGERYIYYWMDQPTDDEIISKQRQVHISSKEITDIMRELYRSYIDDITTWTNKHGIPELSVTDEQRKDIGRAAIFCVNGKTVVRTDYKTGKPDAIPTKAGVGRDAKMFDTILHTLQVMDCYEHGDATRTVQPWMIRIIEKLAYSSINRERRKILEILVDNGGAMTSSQIGAYEGLGLEKDSVNKYLVPLHAVGLVKKKTGGGAFSWFVDDTYVIDFITRAKHTMVDHTPSAGIDLEAETANEKDIMEEFNKDREERKNDDEEAV